MAVTAIIDDYRGEVMDAEEKFNGNRVVYIGWDHHMFFCAPYAIPVPPTTSFRALREEIIPSLFGMHPEFKKINWNEVNWLRNGEAFTPELDVSLNDQGIAHKTLLRFSTPSLKGIAGAGI